MGVPDELHAYTAAEELEIIDECLQERPSGSRVEIWPMPENVVYVDRDLIAACAQLAEERDLRWQAHCSEAQLDRPVVAERSCCRVGAANAVE